MRAPAARAAAIGAALVVGGALGGSAGAQSELGCAPDIGIEAVIEQSPTVFTGTVRALDGSGRRATVEIIRVWKGGPLPRRVEVQGTIATQNKVKTVLDRLYARDRTYLFLPTAGTSPRFRENRCSATRELTTTLAAKAPADGGSAPLGAGIPLPHDDLARFAPLLIGVPAFVVLGGLLAAARLRGRRPRRPRRPRPPAAA